MNIAILHYSAPPIVGGVESVIGHHARLMTSAGHTVRILAGRGASILPGVQFVETPLFDSRHPEILKIKRDLDAGNVPESFNETTRIIAELLRENLAGVDLLFAHNVGSMNKNLPLSTALMEIARSGSGTQLALWHHDLAWITARYQNELYDRYPWNILATPWAGVRRHVVVSELRRAQLAALMKIDSEDIQVIPNGVQIEQFLKLEQRTSEIIEDLNLLNAAPLLLLPVRITRRKNIELALQTLAHLRKWMPEARLLVTGPMGPHNPKNLEYFGELLDLRNGLGLKESAHFMAEISQDFLPDRMIVDFYHIADGLLLTSQEEGFGIPILEAGLCGTPIFCTNIAPLQELAGEDAVYFSPNEEPEKIALSIYLRLKSDPTHHMRNKVRQIYRWESIYQRDIEPLCQAMIQRDD